MRLTVGWIIFLSIGVQSVMYAQNPLFNEAFREFSKSRLWAYEPIPINWQMEGTLQADLNDGVNSLFEDEFEQAEASFSSVISRDSTIWQAYYYRAASRKKQNKLKGAERDLQQTLKIHGEFYEGYVELGKVLHLRGQVDASEKALNKALKLDKTRPVVYYLKGDINLAQNQLRLAVNSYKDCLAVDSLFHDARIKLSLMDLISKQDVSLALNHLDRVLQYDSLQKTALLFRSILAYQKDKEQCVRDLSNLILVSPNNMMAYYVRGVYLTELKNYSQAFSDFHKVIKATSTNDNNFEGQQTWTDKKIDLQNAGAYTVTRVYGLKEEDALKIKQAYCYLITEAFDEAIGAINKIPNANDEPLAVYLVAVALEHKGDHTKALRFYSRALALDNDIADAHKKRGIYEQELKQWDKSIEDFDEALRLYPDMYVLNKIRGVSYYYNNDFSKAIADFSTYLKYDSANKEVLGFRGIAYQMNQQHLEAFLDFAVSGNYEVLNFKKMENLIDSILVKNDTTLALKYLNIFTETTPIFTEGYEQKFKIYVKQGNWKPIKDEILRALRNSRMDVANSTRSYLLTLHAMILSDEHHKEDALNVFDEAIKTDKKNQLAYLERGKLYRQIGKTSKAESDFKQASSLGNEQAKELLSSTAQQ